MGMALLRLSASLRMATRAPARTSSTALRATCAKAPFHDLWHQLQHLQYLCHRRHATHLLQGRTAMLECSGQWSMAFIHTLNGTPICRRVQVSLTSSPRCTKVATTTAQCHAEVAILCALLFAGSHKFSMSDRCRAQLFHS